MYLPLTSIQDAWGVSSLEDARPPPRTTNNHAARMASYQPQAIMGAQQQPMQSKQQQHQLTKPDYEHNAEHHPNYIVQPEQTRVDVALFDKRIVSVLSGMTPQDRTMHVTKALRGETTTDIPLETREYFKPPKSMSMEPCVVDQQLWGMVMFVMIFILMDKLIGIWKKS